jgi:glycosyltransferase involved in cell wall biosynthesis
MAKRGIVKFYKGDAVKYWLICYRVFFVSICYVTIIGSAYNATNGAKGIRKTAPEPHILLVYKQSGVFGGVGSVKNAKGLHGSEVYTQNLFKHLIACGVPVEMLVVNDNNLYAAYRACGFPVYTLNGEGSSGGNLAERIKELCVQTGANVVHCGGTSEADAAVRAAKKAPIRVVLTAHCELGGNDKHFKGVHGALCVSMLSAAKLITENEQQKLGIKKIKFLAPFFDEDAFLHFKTNRSRADFFKQEFDIAIKDAPLITMVANFYPKFKDHATVLRAAQKLVQEEHIPVQVAFAGCGSSMQMVLKLVADLHLQDSVYFLGHIDTIPELYYHTDIAVLSSTSEAFGIALLEAALMKRPLVGTRGTGMESIVKHEQTGLLFGMRNADELTACFKRLIKDKLYAVRLGDAAYDFTLEHYVSHATVRELLAFYRDVLQG